MPAPRNHLVNRKRCSHGAVRRSPYPCGHDAPQRRGYNIYQKASSKLAMLVAMVRSTVRRRHACHYRQLGALETVVRSSGRVALGGAWANSRSGRAITGPADSIAHLVTDHRNTRRRRTRRIVVHQMKAVGSLDARKLLPETSASRPSSRAQR